MEKIKEENKNLIALRSIYFTMMFLLAGGNAGLILTRLGTVEQKALFTIGIYFIWISIKNIRNIQFKITNNLERIKQ